MYGLGVSVHASLHIIHLCVISPTCLENNPKVDFSNRSPLKSELSDESDPSKTLTQISRKKKKEKKKKRKHQHRKKAKRRHEQSSSGGSESDTDSGKDRSSRSLKDTQKESEKPRWGAALKYRGVLIAKVLS